MDETLGVAVLLLVGSEAEGRVERLTHAIPEAVGKDDVYIVGAAPEGRTARLVDHRKEMIMYGDLPGLGIFLNPLPNLSC